MAHVFISYVHEDWDVVIRLRDALKAYDIDVWLDRERIMPGVRWTDVIRDAISGGAFFIACFSEEYSKKDRTYMNEEIIVAIEELRLRPLNRAWFIPVLLSNTEIPNPSIGAGESLRALQWVDLSENWNEGIALILRAISPESAKVLELVDALAHPSVEVRISAIENLAQIGAAGHNALPALLNALGDAQESVRDLALATLRSLGVSYDVIIPKLVSIFESTVDPLNPHAAMWTSSPIYATLVGLGDGIVPAVVAEVDRPRKNLGVRNLLMFALVKIGAPTIPFLVDALDRGGDEEKNFILGVLGNLHEKAKPAVGSIVRLIQGDERNGFLKSHAIGVLGWLRDSSVVPFLITLLNDDVSRFGDHLAEGGTPAEALGNIGDPKAIPAILRAMQDRGKSEFHRRKCASPLAELGGPSVVPILTHMLADEYNPRGLRSEIIRVLEDMWRDQADDAQQALNESVPTLIETMRADEFELRFAAARAVWRIEGRPDLVVPVFEQGLMDSDYRMDAAGLLGKVGPEARSSVPQLMEALRRERLDFVREALVEALAAIDPTLNL